MPPLVRNYTGIQYAELRQQVDPIFTLLGDELEECYYGAKDQDGYFVDGTGWRNGVSDPWMDMPAYDVQRGATPEETAALSKALFDRLHGALWTVYTIYFADEHDRRGKPYGDSVDYVVDSSLPQNRRETRRQEAKRLLRELQQSGFDLATFKTALAARGITFSEL